MFFHLSLSYRSMKNRKFISWLTICSIALSVVLLLGVDRIRKGIQTSFENTISGTDLLVGARSGSVQLLLSTVFRIGYSSHNISWEAYKRLGSHEEVEWTVPLSLGDSHKGFRVVGTNPAYFDRYKVGHGTALRLKEGRIFNGVFELVLGHQVAKKLGYTVGQELVLSHGVGDISFQDHADRPFTTVGILDRTGTPVDKGIYISLEGMKAVHVGWDHEHEHGGEHKHEPDQHHNEHGEEHRHSHHENRDGVHQDGHEPAHEHPEEQGEGTHPREKNFTVEDILKMDLTPHSVTAVLVGLKSRLHTLTIQREINEDKREAMMAILPGLTLSELWETLSMADKGLFFISLFVFVASILGMLSSLLSSLQERRREMAILRALGARPRDLFLLLVSESFLLTLGGILVGVFCTYLSLILIQPALESRYGFLIPLQVLNTYDISMLGCILLSATCVGIIPALTAYKNTLHDGLNLRL